MRVIILLAFIGTGLLFSCNKPDNTRELNPDPAPTPRDQFTLAIDASFRSDTTDNWLFIHDTLGNLLFAKEFETGNILEYNVPHESLPGNQNAITLFTKSFEKAANVYRLKTYQGVDINESWTLRTFSTIPRKAGNLLGEAKVNLSPAAPDMGVSSRYCRWLGN